MPNGGSISIAQLTKNYKIDIVVPSLKAGVELKFADNLEEANKALDEIYTNMHAYRGAEWERLYGLIYSPVPSFTKEQLEAQLERIQADKKWKIIAVHGPDGRKRNEIIEAGLLIWLSLYPLFR